MKFGVIDARDGKYDFIDSGLEVEICLNYLVGFLHNINPPRVPPHGLRLKVGAPIMLQWNLNPPKLCNGTSP